MQEASHPEAVSALRNAGSCVKMKVLRERCVPVVLQAHKKPDAMATDRQSSQEWDVTARRDRSYAPQSSDPTLGSRLIETCNGNKSDDLDELNPTKDTETFKTNALQVVKNTMTIPRIILTHPSTSDEDVEPLTQGSDDRDLYDFIGSEGHVYSNFLNSAFYPV